MFAKIGIHQQLLGQQDCTRLSHCLFDCLSLALLLPNTSSLSNYHSSSEFGLGLLHYPPTNAGESAIRNPAHSDFGSLTLLFQDDLGLGGAGLEIADPSSVSSGEIVTTPQFEKAGGRFILAPPRSGAILINAGYLLMRWTNARWRAAIHRVSPIFQESAVRSSDPDLGNGHMDGMKVESAAAIVPSRFSVPFFTSPNPEVVIEALPGCWDDSNPKRWKPLNAGDFLKRKRQAESD